MSFDPEPYSAGIRAANERERLRIAARLVTAREEARRLALAVAAADEAVQAVYLFGSVAEGSPRRENFDLDLALRGGDLYKALDAAEGSAFEVDLVQFERLPAHVQARILDSGVALWARGASAVRNDK